MKIEFNSIGIIHTPYKEIAPFRPNENAKGEFIIKIDKEYQKALSGLEKISIYYCLFLLRQINKKESSCTPTKLRWKGSWSFCKSFAKSP